ncbi:hypothetical protein D9615_009494 [Tricholomella constricta]|uniref:Uncharacterized protein n=1 Tax=Tricholomella constricta TaxID=117010 RepID=A0A8H5GYS5_9AGAR|nr:hypothetical protein D9615_009494 [Tricholomella constricta]
MTVFNTANSFTDKAEKVLGELLPHLDITTRMSDSTRHTCGGDVHLADLRLLGAVYGPLSSSGKFLSLKVVVRDVVKATSSRSHPHPHSLRSQAALDHIKEDSRPEPQNRLTKMTPPKYGFEGTPIDIQRVEQVLEISKDQF